MKGAAAAEGDRTALDTTGIVSPSDVASEATRLTEAALEWNVDRLEEYDPLTWQDKAKRRTRRKGFNELSLFVRMCSERDSQRPLLTTLADHVVETVNDRRYFELLARNPESILKFGSPFVVPVNRGTLGAEAEAVLERTMRMDSPWAVDRFPFVQLNYYHFLRHIEHKIRGLDPDAILTASNARRGPNFVRVDRKQVYALTHNIFFYTNFGNPDPRFPATTVPSDLGTVLTGLILRFLADNDTDAVAELLLCGIIQRQLDADFVRVVFSWLRDSATDDDVVPGSGVRDATASPDQRGQNVDIDADALGDWNEDSQDWFDDYHTVIASGLCFDILERDWNVLQEQSPTTDFDHGVQRHLDQLLRLGELIRLLSEYKLPEAASLMRTLADTSVVRSYDDVFETCVTFLRNQRTHDGHVGFFTDERYLYTTGENTPEAFEHDLLEPCTERCENALRTVEQSDR